MRINLIGPGRLGKALAASLIYTGEHELLSVYHPKLTSAQHAVCALGHGTAIHNLKLLPKADITLITCPDDKMPRLIKKLSEAMIIQPNSIVMHLSGILSSDILKPLKQQGAHIASLHPLKAFRAASTLDTHAFQGVNCTIEGDAKAIHILTPLWLSMGAHIFALNPEKKSSYHAAAAMASNYLVTLASEASKLFETSGVPQADAHSICVQLMQTSLDNLKQTDTPQKALTGPLVRGDLQTIQKHLDAISSETTKNLYCAAGLATVPLVNLNNQVRKALENLLYNNIVQYR